MVVNNDTAVNTTVDVFMCQRGSIKSGNEGLWRSRGVSLPHKKTQEKIFLERLVCDCGGRKDILYINSTPPPFIIHFKYRPCV